MHSGSLLKRHFTWRLWELCMHINSILNLQNYLKIVQCWISFCLAKPSVTRCSCDAPPLSSQTAAPTTEPWLDDDGILFSDIQHILYYWYIFVYWFVIFPSTVHHSQESKKVSDSTVWILKKNIWLLWKFLTSHGNCGVIGQPDSDLQRPVKDVGWYKISTFIVPGKHHGQLASVKF